MNEEIALLRDWHSEWIRSDLDDPECVGKEYWFAPGSTKPQHLPDFKHDGAHAMTLLEELVKVFGYRGAWDRVCDVATLKSDITQAISHAWLAWKKEE